jgi:hypothetical protein
MLDTVVVESANPLTLHITDVDPSEMLVVKSISGLTSAKVGLFTGDYAGEGSYYQGRRGERLTPVITLKMNPDYANDVEVSDIREILYRAFYEPQPDSDGVKVVLKDDRKPDRYFIGYTEDINTDQFSQSREVQISMVCMESHLASYSETAGSDAVGWNTLPVVYDGSARTGLAMTLKVGSDTDVLTVELNGKKMTLNRSFLAGQTVTINTKKGQRAIQVNGADIMAALTPTSVWHQLDRPNNLFKIYGSVEGDAGAVMTAYNFRSMWWGI